MFQFHRWRLKICLQLNHQIHIKCNQMQFNRIHKSNIAYIGQYESPGSLVVSEWLSVVNISQAFLLSTSPETRITPCKIEKICRKSPTISKAIWEVLRTKYDEISLRNFIEWYWMYLFIRIIMFGNLIGILAHKPILRHGLCLWQIDYRTIDLG